VTGDEVDEVHSPAAAMHAHLRGIAGRVAACGGDIEAVRAVIEDYSKLDTATRRVDARRVPVASPPGEWVLAGNSRPGHRLLYLHGGSWMSGSPAGYRPLAARIARASGCAVFVADYRLAPEHPFPAGLQDGVAAFEWLAANGPEGAAAARSLVLAGDSAGGNLALAGILKLKDEARRLPDAAVALSPAVDLTWQGESLRTHADVDPILRPDRLAQVVQAYVQGNELLTHPQVSPLFGDFSGLPRLLIQVGDREVLLDDARRLASRASVQDVDVALQVYTGMPHVFQVFAPTVNKAQAAIDHIGEFLSAQPD